MVSKRKSNVSAIHYVSSLFLFSTFFNQNRNIIRERIEKKVHQWKKDILLKEIKEEEQKII